MDQGAEIKENCQYFRDVRFRSARVNVEVEEFLADQPVCDPLWVSRMKKSRKGPKMTLLKTFLYFFWQFLAEFNFLAFLPVLTISF